MIRPPRRWHHAAPGMVILCVIPDTAMAQNAVATGQCAIAIVSSGNTNVNCYVQGDADFKAVVDQRLRQADAVIAEMAKKNKDQDARLTLGETRDWHQDQQIKGLQTALLQVFDLLSEPGAGITEKRARELLDQGDPRAAAQLLLKKAKEQSNLAKNSASNAQIGYKNVIQLLQASDYDAARRAALDALAEFPDSADFALEAGQLSERTGKSTDALRYLRLFVSLMERVPEDAPVREERLHDLADANLSIAMILQDRGDLSTALASFRQALKQAELLAKTFPERQEWHVHVIGGQAKIGELLMIMGQPDAALNEFTSALTYAEGQDKREPDTPQWLSYLSLLNSYVGDTAFQTGDYGRALAQYQAAITYSRKAVKIAPDDLDWQEGLANRLNDMATVERRLGQPKAAIDHYTEARSIAQAVANKRTNSAGTHGMIADITLNLGRLRSDSGDMKAALAELEAGLQLSQKRFEEDSDSSQSISRLAMAHDFLGDALVKDGKATQAIPHFAQSVSLLERWTRLSPDDAQARETLFSSLNDWGDALSETEAKAALSRYQSSLALARAALRSNAGSEQWLWNLAMSQSRIGLLAEGARPATRRTMLAASLKTLEKLRTINPAYENLEPAYVYFKGELEKLNPPR